ncbi:Pectinesterase 1 [Ananas comosus]|uniref:Pectinesterase 1 n=1 Tax=Ananas comosus TaxID=4615 RepID=A0A199VJ40_ANACO|nr:Pectinesterase 1 [Ananas comosus]
MILYRGGQSKALVLVRDCSILDASSKAILIDVVVPQDSTENYTTVLAAIDTAPSSSEHRYIIYIQRGTYNEDVSIEKPNCGWVKWLGYHIITDPAVAAIFIVTLLIEKDSWLPSTGISYKSGLSEVRVKLGRVGIGIDMAQDTLYAHSYKQFYRECRITDTLDFIFGDANAVFQFCIILARHSLPGQANTITTQGRDDIRRNTDLAPYIEQIHSCLGRPWRNLSRTVIMETYIGSLIWPEGWLEWNGRFALDTLYYGEYTNSRPGSGLRGQIKWLEYHIIIDLAVAAYFTVARLIDGDSWLPSTGISYKSRL